MMSSFGFDESLMVSPPHGQFVSSGSSTLIRCNGEGIVEFLGWT